jgi:hypothetical protein
MWVFLKGITGECSARDLAKMVNRFVKPGWSLFTSKTNGIEVERSKVYKTMYNRCSQWEYHGLIYISPPESAHKVIGRLNASAKRGRALRAHPYIRRQPTRDRRRLILDQTHPFPDERRRQDRRRVNLVSQIIDAME